MVTNEDAQLEQDIVYSEDYAEYQAVSYYQEPTLSSIRQSFTAVGYDVDKQADRFDSLVTMLVLSEEWDVDSAVAMMEAMDDGWITEAEVNTIMGVDELVVVVEEDEDEAEEEAEDAGDDAEDDAKDASDDKWWDWSPIDWIFDSMVLEPLESILVSVSKNLGERLEKFIANAIGIEREE